MPREYGPSPEEMGIRPEEKKVDIEFSSHVDRLFNKRVRHNQDIGDKTSADVFSAVSSDLKRLSYPGKLEEIREKPGQVSEGLAALAGVKSSCDQRFHQALANLDPALSAENNEDFELADKLFTDGCEKVYPNVEVDLNNISQTIEQIRSQLKSIDNEAILPVIDQEFEKLQEQNLEELIKQEKFSEAGQILDRAIHYSSSYASETSFNLAEINERLGEDKEFSSKTERDLAGVVESIYKLQLLRKKLEARQSIT